MRRSWPRVSTAVTVLCLGLAAGSAGAQSTGEKTTDAQDLGCRRDVGNDVAALVSGAPLVMADFKVGADGTADPLLAAALGVANAPRETVKGLEHKSALEDAIGQKIREHACFRSFDRAVQQGNKDVSGSGRAIMQLEMPLARSYDLTVEYSPGKFRRNFLFQASFGFEIRDPKGRVVFARSHAENYRRTCFWKEPVEAAEDCADLNGDPVEVSDEWRHAVDQGIHELLAGAAEDLVAWRQMLNELTGAFYDRRYSTEVELTGGQVRTRDQLALPYLFVQTPVPRLDVRALLIGLDERGLGVPAEQRAVFENHFDVLFRGALDRSLRATIAGGRAAEDTRVILLSDAQNEAFQNALLIACAAQGQGFNREDCLEPVYLIERLCDDKSAKFGTGRNPRGDACVLASLTYGRSLTSKADRDLEGVREARQLIQAQGHLREPGGPGADQSVVPCRDVKAQKMNTLVVGASDTYYRVDAAAENDDGLYLIDAAHAGLTMQADCMSGRVLERYEAILRAREP